MNEPWRERVEFCYLEQPPSKWTFEQVKLKEWVEIWAVGRVLNLFAGKVRLRLNETRVDISEEFSPDHLSDAFAFVCRISDRFDTVLLDPPYNLRKSREKYGGLYIGSLTKLKDRLPGILNPGGRVISLGYDSVGMSNRRGFKKLAICLVCHGGDHNDTIGLVEEYVQPELEDA